MKTLLLRILVACTFGFIAMLLDMSAAGRDYSKLRKRAEDSGAMALAKPPPASIDPKNRPADWQSMKPNRVGDPPKIPDVFWHNPVIYHDDYVYARGWVTHVVGLGKPSGAGAGGDGDISFNLALDEPYLALRNKGNHEGEIHVEISAYIMHAKRPFTGEMLEAVLDSRENIFKAACVPPATPGLKSSEFAAERSARFTDFASKIIGKHMEVLGVLCVDIAHHPDDPWREIHPCVRLRLLPATENEKLPKINKGKPFEPDKDEDEEKPGS